MEAFCRQYPEKKRQLKEFYELSSAPSDTPVMGGIPGKPTENKALKVLQLKKDVEMIDRCVEKACGNAVGMIDFLKENITEGHGYDKLGYVPCSKNKFSDYRRKFFFLLNKEKN